MVCSSVNDSTSRLLICFPAGLNLFGPGYSGLEYDYRGLQRIYRKSNNLEKLAEYEQLLDEWTLHRSENFMPEFMHFFLSNGADYHEPIPPEGTTLEQLVEDFNAEFNSKLGGAVVEHKNLEAVEVSTTRTPTSNVENEANRSTGLWPRRIISDSYLYIYMNIF